MRFNKQERFIWYIQLFVQINDIGHMIIVKTKQIIAQKASVVLWKRIILSEARLDQGTE